MEAGPLGEAPRSHNIQRSDGDEDDGDDGDDDEDGDDDGESPLMILIGLGHIKFNDWLSSSAFIIVRTSSWHLMLQWHYGRITMSLWCVSVVQNITFQYLTR